MNGLTGSRRLASPVRITLNPCLGGDIDGAWWPHSFALARELPELIEAMHPALGEIIDIKINWSVGASIPVLRTPSPGSVSMHGWNDRQHRLMLVAGRTACARLLVVPSSATLALGRMVMRRAASMPAADGDGDSQLLETARAVVRTARLESSSWSSQLTGAPEDVAACES